MIKQPRYVCRVEKPAADREEAMTKVAEIERIRWAHFREGVSVRELSRRFHASRKTILER